LDDWQNKIKFADRYTSFHMASHQFSGSQHEREGGMVVMLHIFLT
jgi:hypothetical protein